MLQMIWDWLADRRRYKAMGRSVVNVRRVREYRTVSAPQVAPPSWGLNARGYKK